MEIKNRYNLKHIILENDIILPLEYLNIKLIIISLIFKLIINKTNKRRRKFYPHTVIQIFL